MSSKNKLKILEIKRKEEKEKYITPEPLPPHCFQMLILAPVRSGKSLFVTNVCMNENFYGKKYWDEIILFSPTQTFDKTLIHLDKMKNLTRIYEHEDLLNMAPLLHEIMTQQSEAKPEERKRILIIFDDMIQYLNKNSSVVQGLATRFRHYNISCIYSVQLYRALSPAIRNNITCMIVFKLSSDRETDKLDEEIGETMTKDFKKYLAECTKEKYSFMYANIWEQKIYKRFETLIWEKE